MQSEGLKNQRNDISAKKTSNFVLFYLFLLNFSHSVVTERSLHYWLLYLFNPLSSNPTSWLNILKQFFSSLPTNCLSVFDHFVGLALKVLTTETILALKRAETCFLA